ncbi:Unknown protein, partial [Striga hermonthica]
NPSKNNISSKGNNITSTTQLALRAMLMEDAHTQKITDRLIYLAWQMYQLQIKNSQPVASM